MCSMGCAEGIVKLFMFAGNVLFALGGLALIVVGVLYKLNIDDYLDAVPGDYQAIGLAPTLTIVVGSIIFVIAFFGCCGAIKESTCLLTTYAVILLVIFLLQIAVGVFAFLEIKDKDNFHQKINETLDRLFSFDNSHRELPDLIQKEFKCCGLDGPNSYNSTGPWPASCYPNQEIIPQNIYQDGCGQTFYDFLMRTMTVIGITVLALSALEVIGCVFSLCLSSSIKNRERRFRY